MPIPQFVKSPQNWRQQSNGSNVKKNPSWNQDHKDRRESSGIFNKLKLFKIALFLAIIGSIGLISLFVFASWGLPQPDKLMEREVAESTKIYDRSGETLLYEISGDQKRTLVDINQIPQNVQKATIAIEDKNFYHHGGFSIWAIFRTAVTNVVFGKKAGGSTLTQQFVKNAVFTNEKKYTRKIKELILAYKLEKKFTKDQILQMYLNEIPYGSNAYGVEAASQFYFGKSVSEVNLAESAILAALPQGPSRYSPYGANKDALIKRQHYILDLMIEQGYASSEDVASAKEYELKFQNRINNITAPHFVMYLKEMLSEKYGEKTVEQGGLKIITTIDLQKQLIAEKVVKEHALKNQERYNASNAAMVALDPKTGQVLVMVGSRDYFDDSIDGQVNVTIKPRQPGSSFKPIVYTAAFLKGYVPETKVFDVVTNFSTDPSNSYEPRNYNGNEYGPVSFRQALAGSLNTPAVKAMYLAGLDNVLKLSDSLGYSTLGMAAKDRVGLSLVLGGGEVKLLEHTNAYSAFAQEGRVPELNFVLKITDAKGVVLEEYQEAKIKEVFPANIANMTTSILSDNGARSYVFGASNYLTLADRPVAAKTGTTNDYRDSWTIGFTPSLVAGVWSGNNDNSKMKIGADASQVAAPIWRDFMAQALAGTPVENFNSYSVPENTKPIIRGEGFAEQKIKIDKASGLLASELTPAEFIEEKTFIIPHDLLYYINKDNPNDDKPSNQSTDSQYKLWEDAVANWVERQKKDNPDFAGEQPPTESDNIHRAENKPIFTIRGVFANQMIAKTLPDWSIQASAPRGVQRAEYYFNDRLFAINFDYPYGINRPLSILPSGPYEMKVRVCDDIDNCSEQLMPLTLAIPEGSQSLAYTLSWDGPSNNTAISSSSFPIELSVNLSVADPVADLSFYVINPNGESQLIQKKKLVRNNTERSIWSQPANLVTGTYQVWAESYDWQGNKQETEKIRLILKGE